MDQAIRALTIRKRCLQREGIRWQPIRDDLFHLAFAKGATRLLIAQNTGQRIHLGTQRFDIAARRINHRKPFLDFA